MYLLANKAVEYQAKTTKYVVTGVFILNNYSPKAKWLSVNIHRDEVEVNIHL